MSAELNLAVGKGPADVLYCGGSLSVTALHRNAVAEAERPWIVAGPHLEVHLAGLLARDGREGSEHATSANRRTHGLIDDLKIGAIAELHITLDRVLGVGVRRIRCEKELVATVGLVDDKIGIPVVAGERQYLAGSNGLGDNGGGAVAANRLEKLARFLG